MLRALMLGDAKCLQADLAAASKLCDYDAVCACNNAGLHYKGRLDYWVTLHPLPARYWPGMTDALRRRLKEGRNRPQTWAHKASGGVDRYISDWAGSSGLFGVRVLLEEGFERIVLCGVPMNREGAHFYDESRPWDTAGSFHKGWEKHMDILRPHVRSMSGWTLTRLGAPTPEWLGVQPTRRGRRQTEE